MSICERTYCHNMNKEFVCIKCKARLCKACIIEINKKIWCVDCLIEYGLNLFDEFMGIQKKNTKINNYKLNVPSDDNKPILNIKKVGEYVK